MVGLIPKLLLDLVEAEADEDAVAEVKRRARVPQDMIYRLDRAYDDEEWRRLLAATCEVLQLTPEQAETVFADYFCEDCFQRWPAWFEMSSSSREYLERQPKIHTGFATGIEDPEARKCVIDKFHLEKLDQEVVVYYRSPNQLCGLYRAVARRIIDHYGDEATIEETRCLKRGDTECEIHVRWS